MGDDKYLEEVRKGFEEDYSAGNRIGQVWKYSRDGNTPEQIAKEVGNESTGFVYANRTYIRAIEEGVFPDSTSMAKLCGSTLRGFSDRHRGKNLSEENYSRIQEYARKCDQIWKDPEKREAEDIRNREQTQAALNKNIPGVYVYALMHYLRYPVLDPREDGDKQTEDGETYCRTYLKVGMSSTDSKKRVAQQKTAIPEEPTLLRIYECPESSDATDQQIVRKEIEKVEKKMQKHLKAAGHGHPGRKKGRGTEWFLTNLRLLDSTADLLGLKVNKFNQDTTAAWLDD